MVRIQQQGQNVEFNVLGLHKLWALKSRLHVPREHIRGARLGGDVKPGGMRLPGTHIPWVITAGHYWRHGEWEFWDVRHRDKAIVVDLQGERFARLVIEVEDPEAALKQLNPAA